MSARPIESEKDNKFNEFIEFAQHPAAVHSILLDKAMEKLREAEAIIADQAKRLAQMEKLVLHDELTGLQNRRGFWSGLRQEVARLQRGRSRGAALIIIDLDNFKTINDSHGHAVGDAYLLSIANYLQQSCRETDVIARLGGDEFAIILTDLRPADAERKHAKLMAGLNQQVFMQGKICLQAMASSGLELIGVESDPDDAYIHADRKMYASKAARKAA